VPFMAARWCGGEERQGVPRSAPHGGREAGEERGGPGHGGGQRAADRRDRATTRPGGQRLGAGGSEREQGQRGEVR
jgi:hypothetical protein